MTIIEKYNEISKRVNGLIGDDFHFKLAHDDKYIAT